jgi:hypothetical protein
MTNGKKEGWMDGWMDGWIDRQKRKKLCIVFALWRF